MGMEDGKMTGREACLYLSLKYEGSWEKIYEAVRKKEPPDLAYFEKAKESLHCSYVTIVDKEYPRALTRVPKPPFVLYYYGDLSLSENEDAALAYIGSREASAYGMRMARKIVTELAEEGVTVVTGLARGIDAEAARSAFIKGGKTIAVLGSGIDLCYPSSSQDLYEQTKHCGLLLSEYPGLTEPKREHFPMRNRIVAALAKGVIVGEANERSGTLITVSYALELGKEVGCVPFEAGKGSGCNQLIRDGAYLIESGKDALSMIGRRPKKDEKKEKQKTI